MLAETRTSPSASYGNVDIGQANAAADALVGSIKQVARTAFERPSFTPIYVEHKKKVPLTTFELNTACLNPLAHRGLERLPRINGVPVIRAVNKDDGLGFAFQFRIEPTEMTIGALPAMLERWYEKYEVAKAKAGLTPKPEKPPEPLAPRSPRRKMEIMPGQELDDQIKGVEVIKVDMSVVDSAIKSFEAQEVGAMLASSQAIHSDLPDPLSGGVSVGEMSGEVAEIDKSIKVDAPDISTNTRKNSSLILGNAESLAEDSLGFVQIQQSVPTTTRAKSKYEPLPYHYVVGNPEDDDENNDAANLEAANVTSQRAAEDHGAHGADVDKEIDQGRTTAVPTCSMNSTPVVHPSARNDDWPLDDDYPISFGDDHEYVPFDALDTVAPHLDHHPKASKHAGFDEIRGDLITTVEKRIEEHETGQEAIAAPQDVTEQDLAELEPIGLHLPAVRLQAYEQDITSQQWADDQAKVWTAWTNLSFSVASHGDNVSPEIKVSVHDLPINAFAQSMEDELGDALMPVVTLGSNIQIANTLWLPTAIAQLTESIEDTMKAARTPMARRYEFLKQAVQELPHRLDSLQAMLVDLQLANDLARRVRKNILGMPEWATVVLTTLELNEQWHQSYLDAANFREATAVLARWSQPLAELKLINQLGLFGDPQTLRLLRQLVHIVEHAKKWSQPTGTRGDSSRVLAVWVDVVHHFTPECAQEEGN